MTEASDELREISEKQIAKSQEYMQQVPGTIVSFVNCSVTGDLVRLVVGDAVGHELLLKGHLVLSLGAFRQLAGLCQNILKDLDRANAERAKGLN